MTNNSDGGSRYKTVRLKTARKRSVSSARWLERQLNDPYVQRAKRDGYRSRAAYKLIELDEKFHLLKPGMRVLDLGAAPGGWTQVAGKKIGTGGQGSGGRILGIDLLPIPPIPGATLVEMDFMADDAPERIKEMLGGAVHLVMSDMAPNSTGHAVTDHLRIMGLCEAAYYFACEVLAPGGAFVAKVWQGGTENALLAEIKKRFTTVKHAKPKASRTDSAESYLVAMGFKGGK